MHGNRDRSAVSLTQASEAAEEVHSDPYSSLNRIAAKPDEVIYVAVTLLKEAIEIMKRAPDQVREDPADRGIWVRV